MTAADFTGKTEIVALERRTLEDEEPEVSFEFRKQRFCHDAAANSFHKLPYPVQVLLASNMHVGPWRVADAVVAVDPATLEECCCVLLACSWTHGGFQVKGEGGRICRDMVRMCSP